MGHPVLLWPKLVAGSELLRGAEHGSGVDFGDGEGFGLGDGDGDCSVDDLMFYGWGNGWCAKDQEGYGDGRHGH
jgi:hypothetical protein